MFNPLERIHDRKGAYIVILALIFPACLLIMGAMVDIGLFYRTRAHLQSVADAAALAGAQDLPNCATSTTTANNYVPPSPGGIGPWHNYVRNATVAVDFSDNGTSFGATGSRFCRVTLTAPAQSAIMENVLGSTTNITVRAVSEKNAGYAIFANEGTSADNQSALYMTTNDVTIAGNIHSNKKLSMKGPPTITNGTVTSVVDSPHATTTAKKPMPDLSKMPGTIRKGKNLTFNAGVGTPTVPIIYTAETGNMTVTMNTTANCYASFYAPKGNISFQGNALKLYGSIVANSIDFQLVSLEIHTPLNAPGSSVRLSQ